jgi:hypothetical protein
LLAYLLLQYPSSFLLLLQSSSKEFIATSLLRVKFLFLLPPPLFSLGSVNCRDSYKSSNA